MTLPAGNLNRRITIQRMTGEMDEVGQPLAEWVDEARVWAWIKTQTGMGMARQYSGPSDVAAVLAPYSFRIRYRPSITDAMRVLHGGLIFDIRRVQHDLAGKVWTDLVCEQGGNNG